MVHAATFMARETVTLPKVVPPPSHRSSTASREPHTLPSQSLAILKTDERVASVTTPRVAFRLTPEDSLDHAARILSLVDAAHWPVTRGRSVVGLISMDALLSAARLAATIGGGTARPGSGPPSIAPLMGRPPRACAPSDSLSDAAAMVVSQQLTCLSVSENDRQVGVLVLADFVRVAISLIEVEKTDRHRDLTVGDLMGDRPVVVARAGDSIGLVETMMRELGVRHLPVMDGGRLIGVVSDRLLLNAVRGRVDSAWSANIRYAMAATPPITTRESSAAAAGRLLCTQLVGALPVTSPTGLVGVLTRSDYLRFLVARAEPPGREVGPGRSNEHGHAACGREPASTGVGQNPR